MVFAKKKWGQNFLVDNNLLEKIIKTIDIKKDDEILEIGPGHGALSEKIIQKTKALKMVEIDPELIKVIGQNQLLTQFEIFKQDIIKTTLDEFDEQTKRGLRGLSARAVQSGAFGGTREGVERAIFQSQADKNRAALQAQLLGQGFTQAQNQQQQQLGNLQTMAQTVPGLQQTEAAGLEALGLQLSLIHI